MPVLSAEQQAINARKRAMLKTPVVGMTFVQKRHLYLTQVHTITISSVGKTGAVQLQVRCDWTAKDGSSHHTTHTVKHTAHGWRKYSECNFADYDPVEPEGGAV